MLCNWSLDSTSTLYDDNDNDDDDISTTVSGHEVEYPCCPGKKYGDVTYSFRMRPRSAGQREVRSGNLLPPPSTDDAEGPVASCARVHLRTTNFDHRLPLFLACVTWFGHVI